MVGCDAPAVCCEVLIPTVTPISISISCAPHCRSALAMLYPRNRSCSESEAVYVKRIGPHCTRTLAGFRNTSSSGRSPLSGHIASTPALRLLFSDHFSSPAFANPGRIGFKADSQDQQSIPRPEQGLAVRAKCPASHATGARVEVRVGEIPGSQPSLQPFRNIA